MTAPDPEPGFLSGPPMPGPVDRNASWKRVRARRAATAMNGRRNAAPLANSISQGGRHGPVHGGTFDSPSHGFQIFHFDGATLALSKVSLAPQRIRHVQFSVEKRMENEFPFRTGAGRTHPAFGAKRLEHRDAHQVVERRSAGPRLDDDLAFHVGVDRALVVIVARGCKSERECGFLGEHF